MSTIPSPDKYPESPTEPHPRIAERRHVVQQERLIEGLMEGGQSVEELLGPDRWSEITED